MTRKLFKIGGLDVTIGKLIVAGVALAGLATGTCAVCRGCEDERPAMNSDAMASVDRGTVQVSVKRQDRDNDGNVIGFTEYSVTVGPNEETQELDIQRNNGQSATYKDSSLLDDEIRRMDNRVDEIYFPGLGVKLVRSKDYGTNKHVFDDADDELRAARARFESFE